MKSRTLSEFYRSPDYKGPLCGNLVPAITLNERGVGSDMIYTGSNQRVPEFHSWACLVRGLGARSYVELGVGSAWSIRDAGVTNIVTVDLLPGGLPGIPHVQGNSHDLESLHQVLTLLGGPPDIVFIDADHTYEGCRDDFDMWYPAARLAIGFHDIRLREGCDRFWDEVSQQYSSVEIIGRDHASAEKWQGTHDGAGRLWAGGIGVIFK